MLAYISVTHITLGRKDWWKTLIGGLDVLSPKEEISVQ